MTDSAVTARPVNVRFLEFPREIRDLIYTHLFRREYTIRDPRYFSKQNASPTTVAQKNDLSNACEALSLEHTSPRTAPHPHSSQDPTQSTKTNPSPSFAILRTSKRINAEAAEGLYASGLFHFPSDVLMECDLAPLQDKVTLLKNIELHFDMDLYEELEILKEGSGIPDSTCASNVELLGDGIDFRRSICSVILENWNTFDAPPRLEWFNALEGLVEFDMVVVKIMCPGWSFGKTLGVEGEVRRRSKKWDKVRDDVIMGLAGLGPHVVFDEEDFRCIKFCTRYILQGN